MGIRIWNKNDLAGVVQLLSELDEAINGNQAIDAATLGRQYNEMSKYPELYENVVYEEEAGIVGFLALLHYRSGYHKNGTTQINELVVKDGYRNKGIGKALLEYAEKRARTKGMDEIEVGVKKDNSKAIAFYKRNGITEEYLLLGKDLVP